MNSLKPAIRFAHLALQEIIKPGDMVVDATAGNGNDTLFLARLVGGNGIVHAFDIQEEALARTEARLREAGLLGRVRPHLSGHERMLELLPAERHGEVGAVMFNLGFLPKDRAIRDEPDLIVTRPETTLAALDAALRVLAPGGVMTIACYAGHELGRAETEAVHGWCAGLSFDQARVLRYEILNKPGDPICLYCVEKKAASS